jgi:hypothetical protein
MSVSNSKSSYLDCYELFDRALDSEIGIRKKCISRGMANNLRTRLHYARAISRRESLEIYAADHPQHGQSSYDPLVIRVQEDDEGWWIYIEPRRVDGEVEELAAE